MAACDHWTSKPYPTKGHAERKAKDIDHMGNCPAVHVVLECAQDEFGVLRFPDGRRVP